MKIRIGFSVVWRRGRVRIQTRLQDRNDIPAPPVVTDRRRHPGVAGQPRGGGHGFDGYHREKRVYLCFSFNQNQGMFPLFKEQSSPADDDCALDVKG
jgi:hypothetical protein